MSTKGIKAPTAAERILERDLGAPLEAHLQSLGYTVSKEVKYIGKIADIVCVSEFKLITVEMKTEVTLAVLAQAVHWTEHVNETWIAVPEKKMNDVRAYGYRVCCEHGIGVLTVRPLTKIEQSRTHYGVTSDGTNGTYTDSLLARVTMVIPALCNSYVDTSPFHEILRPEHQTFSEAGTKSGLRVGPFQDMCHSVRDHLQACGGASPLESVAKVARRPSKVVVDLLTAKRIPMVRLDGTGEGAMMVRLCKVGEEGVTLSERESKLRPVRYVPGLGRVQA